MSVLILVEHKKGSLVKASLNVINAASKMAAQMGCGYNLAVIGSGVGAAVAAVKNVGATKIYVADDAKLSNYLDESWADVLTAIAKASGAKAVVGLASTQGKAVLPRVAAKLDAGMASEVSGITDNLHFMRPVYAGNLNAEVEITTEIKVASIRGTAFEPIPAGAEAAVENVAVSIDPNAYRKKFVKMDEVVSDRPPLTEARIVVSFGRGIKAKENIPIVERLADTLKAAIGATRVVVDAGMIHNDYQVGQTGKVVAPDLYIAIGMSGAIQHLAGMKDSKVIVAINKDEEAPIFQVADYGIVADLFQAVPEMTDKIQAIKNA